MKGSHEDINRIKQSDTDNNHKLQTAENYLDAMLSLCLPLKTNESAV